MKNLFNRSLSLLCALAMLLSILPMTFAEETAEFAVLSTTDMHGRCWDVNVLNDTNMTNSMLNVSTAVNTYRQTYGDSIVLIDNGDTYQGTPVSTLQISNYTQGLTTDPNPMALAMKYIGYDAANTGNHEYNYAWNTMSDIYDYLEADVEGLSPVASLGANLYYDGTDGIHEAGTNAMTPYLIKNMKDTKGNDVKVAILAFVTPDCTRWDVPENYPGMRFYHPDNAYRSMRWEAEKWVAAIEEAEAPDFLIVAFHSGLGNGSADENLIYGTNTENQVLSMIQGTTGIDMVIAGHDHNSSYTGKSYKNANGEDVLVVNGAGNDLTVSVFTVNGDGTFSLKSSKNDALKNYKADTALKALIQPYADAAIAYVEKVAGVAVGNWNNTTKFYLQQSDTMDLIGRAQMAQGSIHLEEKYNTEELKAALFAETGLTDLTVDLSSTSVVINGSYNVKAGNLSMKDIYRMYRYDNSLYLLPVSGKEIKDILEFNAATHLSVSTASGTPVFSTTGDDFTNPIFYGIDFKYDMSREKYDRITGLKFADGREVVESEMYILAVNNYHLGNASGPFANYATTDCIWSQTDDMGGGFVQDLIAEFLAAETAKNGGVAPAPSNWEIVYTGEITAGKAEGAYIANQVDPTTLVSGDQIIIFYPAGSTAVSSVASGKRLSAVEVTSGVSDADVKQVGTDDTTVIFTVVKHEDGTFSFVDADGKYMTSAPTGNGMSMEAELSDCGKWDFVSNDSGWYIHNVGANYNGNYNQYMEYYQSCFTTYGLKETAIYVFDVYKLAPKDIVILYTNDIHTYINNDGLKYSNVAALKAELEAAGKDVILVDAGDHIQGTAYGSMDKGETIIKLMNAAGYDLATLGNHEFDYGMARALELIGKAEFPYVSANFYHETAGVRGENVLNSSVIVELGGKKIAIIGITTPETFTKSTPAYFMDENGNYIYGIGAGDDGSILYADVQAAIDAVRYEVDYVIALGHLGDDPASDPWNSEDVISNVSGLDAFIDGHSHSTVEGKDVADKDGNLVRLTQTGQYLDAIGMLTISEDVLTTELITEYTGVNEEVKAIEDAWAAEVDTLLGEVIAKSDVDFKIKDETGRLIRKQETNLGDFCADALYYLFDVTEGLKVDLAIMNGGGIRADMPAGDISYKTTKTVHTFGNVACLITVTGQQILDALEWGAKNVGVGENGGFLQVSGVTYEIHSYIPSTVQADDKGVWAGAPTGEYRVKNVKIGGEDLDVTKSYNLAGYNYTLRDLGDGFAMFSGAVNVKDYVMEDYMVLANYAQSFPVDETTKLPTITAENSVYGNIYGAGRITIVAEEEVENPFPDVSENEWYYDYVMDASKNGLIIGFEDGTFAPEANLTRAEWAMILYRLCGVPSVEGATNPFTDLVDEWYQDAIIYLASIGVTNGTGDGKFEPDANITREEMVTMLYRLIDATGAVEDNRASFADGELVSEWAIDAMNWAIAAKIIAGHAENNTLEPQGLATRAQAAKVATLFAELLK